MSPHPSKQEERLAEQGEEKGRGGHLSNILLSWEGEIFTAGCHDLVGTVMNSHKIRGTQL